MILVTSLLTITSPAIAIDTPQFSNPELNFVDTSIHTENIPETPDYPADTISIAWIGLEHSSETGEWKWTLKGFIVNGTDSDIEIPLKYRTGGRYIVDLTLIEDDVPLSSNHWCGTLDILRNLRRTILPARSILNFAVPVSAGHTYSVVIETRDYRIESKNIDIDKMYDGAGRIRIPLDGVPISVDGKKFEGKIFESKKK